MHIQCNSLEADGSIHSRVCVCVCVCVRLRACLFICTGDFELSCQRNPLVVNVTHNLSLPFFLTSAVMLNFSSAHVGVTGVALRTSCLFSAFALTGCAEGVLS